jgi:hypothetical protein
VTATGYYDGVPYSDTDLANYYGAQNPGIDLQKYVSVDGGLTWQDADDPPGPVLFSGIVPRFSFVVTNTGNTPLYDVIVTDSVFGVVGADPLLAPGDSFEWGFTGLP